MRQRVETQESGAVAPEVWGHRDAEAAPVYFSAETEITSPSFLPRIWRTIKN